MAKRIVRADIYENFHYTVLPDGVNVDGDRNWRNNNPGNLTIGGKSSFCIAHGSVGIDDVNTDDAFAIFPNVSFGMTALRDWLTEQVAGAVSLEKMMEVYAPKSDNNKTSKYIDYLKDRLGISKDTLLSTLTPQQIDSLEISIIQYEGIKRPTIYNANNIKKAPDWVKKLYNGEFLPEPISMQIHKEKEKLEKAFSKSLEREELKFKKINLKNLKKWIEQLEKLDKLLGVKYTGPTSLDWLKLQPNAQTIFGAYEKIALQLEQLQHKLGSISLGVALNFSAFDKDYLAALKAYQLADVNFKTSSNLSITDGLATLDNNVKQGVNSAGGILDAQATNISKSVSGSAAQTTLAEATRDAATGAEQTAKGQSGAMDSFEAAGILGAAVGAITAAQHVVAAAQGGLVTKPTVALLGEAGQSEAVIPLSNLRTDPKRPQADMEIGTYSSHFPGVTSLAPSSTRKKQTASLQYLVQQQQANRRSGNRNG